MTSVADVELRTDGHIFLRSKEKEANSSRSIGHERAGAHSFVQEKTWERSENQRVAEPNETSGASSSQSGGLSSGSPSTFTLPQADLTPSTHGQQFVYNKSTLKPMEGLPGEIQEAQEVSDMMQTVEAYLSRGVGVSEWLTEHRDKQEEFKHAEDWANSYLAFKAGEDQLSKTFKRIAVNMYDKALLTQHKLLYPEKKNLVLADGETKLKDSQQWVIMALMDPQSINEAMKYNSPNPDTTGYEPKVKFEGGRETFPHLEDLRVKPQQASSNSSGS